MQLPNSKSSATELDRSAEQPKVVRTSNQMLAALAGAVAKGDASAASQLVVEAESGAAGDPALRSTLLKCKSLISRAAWLDEALHAMRHDFEDDRFTSALGHFREALALSRHLPLLKARVDEQAEKYAEELLPHNWRIAQTLMQEAAQVDPPLKPDGDLQKQVRQACEDEVVTLAIFKADRLEQEGKTSEARQWLHQFLANHPKEARITDRIHLLDYPEEAAVLEAAKLTADPVPPAVQPPDSELDTVGTLTDLAPVIPKPWRTRVVISNETLDTVKNWCAIGAAAAMLGLAGFLIWKHFAAPAKPVRMAVVSAPGSTSATRNDMATAPAQAQRTVFEDVPLPPSDQDQVLAAVRDYVKARASALKIDTELLDEVAISGNEATVRYRAKEKGSGKTSFSLLKKADHWQVQSTHN